MISGIILFFSSPAPAADRPGPPPPPRERPKAPPADKRLGPPLVQIKWTKPIQPITLAVDLAVKKASYKASDGSVVNGYFNRPQGNGPFPAVMELHGRSGQGDGRVAKTYDAWLASQGYVGFSPNYAAPVGFNPANLDTNYAPNLDKIRQYLGDGLDALKSLPYVDPNKIYVIGHSLGGEVALYLATRDDVAAVCTYSAAVFPERQNIYPLGDLISQIKAPMIMFHGDSDKIVPYFIAEVLELFFSYYRRDYELVAVPGADHVFDLEGVPWYHPKAAADAKAKMLSFFKANTK